MTDKLTNVNAVKAPKLTNITAESRLIKTADMEITAMNTILATGVLYFGCREVNNFFGKIDSRPSAYRKRLTLVTEETPCVKVAIINVIIKIELSRFPPTILTRL